jgi:hypothetical protein
MSFCLWLLKQPEITRKFDSDHFELISCIESVFEGGGRRQCFMGRGRGTTTILELACKYAAMHELAKYPIVVTSSRVSGRRDHVFANVHAFAGLAKAVDGVFVRPDLMFVDFGIDRSFCKHERNMEALRLLVGSHDTARFVFVNCAA